MKSTKKISGAALIALKEALTHIYWVKNDLKSFVNHTINNKSFVVTLDMTKYKREIVSDIVDRMSNRLDIYEEDLFLLLKAVLDMTDFSHLKKWEDADKKVKQAKDSVEALKIQAKGYFELIKEQEKLEERRTSNQNKLKKKESRNDELNKMKQEFNRMCGMTTNKQQRGFDFERLLNSMFHLVDLDPKCSYKAQGEQIDGAFTHDNQDYLIEAKWEDKTMPKSSFHTFSERLLISYKILLVYTYQ